MSETKKGGGLTTAPLEAETWHEVEYSRPGEGDWFSTSQRRDTLAGARRLRDEHVAWRGRVIHDYRIIRKTVTVEVIEEPASEPEPGTRLHADRQVGETEPEVQV